MSKFLILGCQRTGTTLLRLMMDSHPDVVCHDENTSYDLYQTERETDYLEGYKMPSYTELFLEYEEIAALYKGEKILFMERSMEDVVCSMAKLPRPDGSFLNDVETSLADWEHDENRKRFQAMVPELHSARQGPFPLYRQGALFWKYKTATLGELQKQGYPVLPVKYEDLVQRPRITTQSIADFLGIEWHPLMQNPQAVKHGDVGVGRTTPQPLHSASVGQWRKMLRPAILHAMREVIRGDQPEPKGCCGKRKPPVTAKQAQKQVREAQNGSQKRTDTKYG